MNNGQPVDQDHNKMSHESVCLEAKYKDISNDTGLYAQFCK